VITGSELVGVAPYPAIRASGEHYLSNQGSSRGIPVQDIIATAVQSLGLCDISNFDPERSVIGLPTTSGPLTSQTVDGFVDEVSRDSPAPGGGSIAALAGSLGAALSSMVANLTFTKRKYRKRRAEMETIAIEAQRLKDDLLRAVDEDTEAFESVIAALRLPQGTPEQEKIRAVAIEAGYRHAIEVPLNSAELCLEVMRLALKAAHRGLPAGVTDAGTAVWMARAGFEGAILNVRINLSEIKDEKWRSAIEERILLLRKDAESLLEQCQQQLEEILGS
ncbi:MAG TPA: glutamate formimidoyltransferase, partial [Planctomycetes bacterium]|nr:glutamate formimidoyltransferase [Planctomycetota bacterium]